MTVELCKRQQADYSNLMAFIINCTEAQALAGSSRRVLLATIGGYLTASQREVAMGEHVDLLSVAALMY